MYTKLTEHHRRWSVPLNVTPSNLSTSLALSCLPLFLSHATQTYPTPPSFALPPLSPSLSVLPESVFLPSTRLTTAHSLGSPSPTATWISTWLPQQDRLSTSALPHYNLPRTLAFEEAASRWVVCFRMHLPARLHINCSRQMQDRGETCTGPR